MPVQHKLLHISSRDRDLAGSASTSDFVINTNNLDKLQNIKAVVLKTVTIPNVMYNIRDSNRSFTYNIASSPTTVQIAAGQYTLTEFMTALQTALAAVGATVAQNSVTKRIEFTSTTPIEYLTEAQGNAMAEVVGILTGSGSDVGAFNPTGLPALDGHQHVHVRSQTLADGSNLLSTSKQPQSTLGIVPIDVPFGSIIHYQTFHSEIDDVDYLTSTHGRNIQTIDVKLTDHTGAVLDLQGHNCSLILKIYY